MINGSQGIKKENYCEQQKNCKAVLKHQLETRTLERPQAVRFEKSSPRLFSSLRAENTNKQVHLGSRLARYI